MNKEINKYLTEAIGECWHTWDLTLHKDNFALLTLTCKHCLVEVKRNESTKFENDFFTWEGFGKLWEWARSQEWWSDFSRYLDTPTVECNDVTHIDFRVISPETFASSIYDFLINKVC